MADLEERQKKAFDFVSDYTKQLITLATGIITLTVTFLGDELKASSVWSKSLLIASWGLFTLSICFGIMRLMALTGNLDPIKQGTKPNLTITSANVRKTGMAQILAFALGLFLSVVFGIFQLFNEPSKQDKNKTIIILQQPAAGSAKGVVNDTIYPGGKKNAKGSKAKVKGGVIK